MLLDRLVQTRQATRGILQKLLGEVTKAGEEGLHTKEASDFLTESIESAFSRVHKTKKTIPRPNLRDQLKSVPWIWEFRNKMWEHPDHRSLANEGINLLLEKFGLKGSRHRFPSGVNLRERAKLRDFQVIFLSEGYCSTREEFVSGETTQRIIYPATFIGKFYFTRFNHVRT